MIILTGFDWQGILRDHRIYPRMRCLLAVYSMTPLAANDRKCLPYEMEVASKDIAEKMNVSRPSVHVLLDALQKDGLIHKEHYGKVVLTSDGKKRAMYLRKHLLRMTAMIEKRLGTTVIESAILACQCVDMMDEKRLVEIERMNLISDQEKDVMTCCR